MKLEVGHIFINDIQFASESKIENGVLYVDEEAVKAIVLEDEKIKDVKFDIAKPGESVRITPVKDVIEPRVKVEGRGGVFPGVIAKVDTVGSGKTYALKGMAVVTAGKIVGFQEGIIDMSGPGAEYTPFSKLNNLVVVCEPVEGIKQHEYEKAVRLAGFRVAVYLGELARELTPDETKTYETYGIMEGKEKFPNLPRVAYVQMLQSQGLLHDTYVYGVDAKQIVQLFCSQSALFTIRALPSEKSMNFSICFLKQAALWAISSLVSILRISVRPEGSPIMVVPPPIRAMGLLPASCRRFIRVSARKWPAVRLSAVQSKPM